MAFQPLTSASGANKGEEPGHLGDSWIEMYYNSDRSGNNSGLNSGNRTPERITPLPFSSGGGEEYLRLLREAQRESRENSRVVSLNGSRRDSPRSSPKSPPNSPNNELATDDDFKDILINYYKQMNPSDPNLSQAQVAANPTKRTWDWNSRPDQCPPKVWKLPQSEEALIKSNKGYSIRLAKVGKTSIFSKEVFYSLLVSNIFSLIVGTGIGLWLTKRGLSMTRVMLD